MPIQIRPITEEVKFITSDGQKFGQRRNAISHQDSLNFYNWYNAVDTSKPADTSADAIYIWLKANRRDLKQLIESWETI